jgi:hypothetical protein
MGAVARAELEALLRARKLDRTVTRAVVTGQGVVATGLPALDQALGGGLPRGEMSEVAGPRSSGRSSLFSAALAAATGRGDLAVLVDTLDMFDAESGSQAGIRLDRLLWVRGDALSRHPDPPAAMPPGRRGASGRRFTAGDRGAASDAWTRVLDRAVKALNLVLQAGTFDLAVLDVAEVQAEAIRRLPFTTWFRLQRTLEGGRTACLLVASAPIARSAGGVTLELRRGDAASRWSGQPGGVRLFQGLDLEARVVRAREADADRCHFTARA